MGPRIMLWVQVADGTVSRVEGEAPRQALPHDSLFASWVRLGWRPVSAAASAMTGHDVVILEHTR